MSDDVRRFLYQIYVGEELIREKDVEWQRFRREYENDFGQVDDELIVNYVFSTTQSEMAQLYFKNPYMVITPKKVQALEDSDLQSITSPEQIKNLAISGKINPDRLSAVERARILEIIENYNFVELNISEQIEACLLDAEIYGEGWMKVGYTYKKDYQSKDKNELINYIEHETQEGLHVYRLSPYQLILPIGYTTVRSMPWIIIKTIKPLSEVKANKAYKNTDEITGEYIDMNSPYGSNMLQGYAVEQTRMSDEPFVRLYTKWDRRQKQISTITGDGVEIENKKWELILDDFPILHLKLLNSPDKVHGIPGIRYIEGQNLELNAYRTKQARHVHAFKTILLVRDNAVVDKEEFRRIIKGPDGGMAFVHGDAGTAAAQMPNPPLNTEQSKFQENCKQDIMVAKGLGDDQLGALRRGDTSATQAAIVEQNKKLRIDKLQNTVARFVQDIVRKMVQVDLQTLTKKKVVKITGETGLQWDRVVDVDIIKGEYDVDVVPGSTLPLSEEKRRNDLLFVKDLVQNPIFAPFVNAPGLLQELIRSLLWIKNPEMLVNTGESEREARLLYIRDAELMWMGRQIQVPSNYNHLLAIRTVSEFLRAQPEQSIPPQAVPIFSNYIDQNVAFLNQARGTQTQGTQSGPSYVPPAKDRAVVSGLPVSAIAGIESGNDSGSEVPEEVY